MDAQTPNRWALGSPRPHSIYGAEQRDIAHHLGLNPSIIAALESDDLSAAWPTGVRPRLSQRAMPGF
jgi:hypothetical protein